MGLDSDIVKGVKKNGRKNGKMETSSIWYGRKENEVHGWMQRWFEVPEKEFNGGLYPITEELLVALEADAKAGKLTYTEGYAFGGPNTAAELEQVVEEILRASREALKETEIVGYTSWW